jgi:hypothetical protein
MILKENMGAHTTFYFLCIFKLANDVINSTSFIHVYGHVRVARCMIWVQGQKTSKMFDGYGY